MRSQEVAALLSGLNIAEVGWKVITLKDGRKVPGLKTVAEIMKEAGLYLT